MKEVQPYSATSCRGGEFRISYVSVDVEGCPRCLVRKSVADSHKELGLIFFAKTNQNTVILFYLIVVCVFMNKEKIWKDTHLTLNVDSVCVLEQFGQMRILFFFAHPSFLWLVPSWSVTVAIKKVPKSMKLKKWSRWCSGWNTVSVGGVHATDRSCCCYCWQRTLQVAEAGPKQGWQGAERRWESEPGALSGFSSQLSDLGPAIDHSQPQSSHLCNGAGDPCTLVMYVKVDKGH